MSIAGELGVRAVLPPDDALTRQGKWDLLSAGVRVINATDPVQTPPSDARFGRSCEG